MRVGIALLSHPNQIEIMDSAGSYMEEGQPYLDAGVWVEFLAGRVGQVREVMGVPSRTASADATY